MFVFNFDFFARTFEICLNHIGSFPSAIIDIHFYYCGIINFISILYHLQPGFMEPADIVINPDLETCIIFWRIIIASSYYLRSSDILCVILLKRHLFAFSPIGIPVHTHPKKYFLCIFGDCCFLALCCL